MEETDVSASGSFSDIKELALDSSIETDQSPIPEDCKDEKKGKGTKRKASIELQQYKCEVCQVKLNSASQAYQHFQGKGHQGKVKMLEMAAEVTAPSFSSLPAVPQHTSSQPTTVLSPSTIEHYCVICEKIFNSKNQAEQHFSGKAHRHKLSEKAIANINPTHIPGVSRPPLGMKNNELVTKQPDLIKIGGNVKSPLFSCEHCHITLNSQRQYDQHVNGLRHKIIVGKAKPPPPPQGEEPGWQEIRYKKLATAMTTVGLLSNAGGSTITNPGGTRLGQYYCKDCDVSVNSPIQLQQHMTSAKHSAKLNGVEAIKKKPGRGRFGVKTIGRGLTHGRGVPSLSTNFIKSGQMASNQCTLNMAKPATIHLHVPSIPASQNGTAVNIQEASYQTKQISHYNSCNYFQPSYPT